jgi:hypothetical protein
VGDLYYLSFRDIAAPASTGVTSTEVYCQSDVDPAFGWQDAILQGGNWVAWGDVANVFRGKRVCFVLHGFNVPLDSGIRTCGPAAQSYEALGDYVCKMTGADLAVPVLWPGDGFILWSYFTANAHAVAIGTNFATFLASAACTALEVSFISHSLGARLVLETVTRSLAPERQPSQAAFGTAIFMAPAVDSNALDYPFAAATGPGGLKRIVVLSSPTDSVLSGVFPFGDAVEQALWLDFKGTGKAMGLVGPVFADKSTARPITEWYEIGGGQDHGDYLPDGDANPVWEPKPEKVTLACSEVVNLQTFAQPPLNGWATDKTGTFRPGWVPRL